MKAQSRIKKKEDEKSTRGTVIEAKKAKTNRYGPREGIVGITSVPWRDGVLKPPLASDLSYFQSIT